jgi:hypothetical protein
MSVENMSSLKYVCRENVAAPEATTVADIDILSHENASNRPCKETLSSGHLCYHSKAGIKCSRSTNFLRAYFIAVFKVI